MSKSYNSTLKDILTTEPTDTTTYRKDDINKKEIYKKFNEDYLLYLSKLPNNNVKKYVNEVFSRDLVYFGHNQLTKNVGLNFAKVVADHDKLYKISLDTKEFGIDLKTGECKNIDDCIYATYFAFIRFAIVANRTNIKKDDKLQKLLAQYLYQIFMSVIDTSKVDTGKQKFYIKMLSYYVFYKHFIRETSAATIKILNGIFKDEKDLIDEFKPLFKNIDKYTSVKDFAKILLDTNVLQIDPNVFSINLLRKYKQHAFYCIYGSLDMFTAFSIITKYPFELFENIPTINNTLQENIEKEIVSYMRKVKYN